MGSDHSIADMEVVMISEENQVWALLFAEKCEFKISCNFTILLNIN